MMNDRQFAKSFFWMIFLLVLLTVFLIVLGIFAGGGMDSKLKAQSEEYTQRLVAKRTQPVGNLNVGDIAEPDAVATSQATQLTAAADSGTAASGDTGENVYNQACYICHNPGLTGAPKPGDAEDWGPRIAKGVDVLYENAIKGYTGSKGVMPPKGGNLLITDDEVRAVVDYLVALAQ